MNSATTTERHSDTKLPENLKALATELRTYQRELSRLLEEGEASRFAVIQGDQVLATWDTYRDALQYGYERFGDQLFMVQRVDARDAERLERFAQGSTTEPRP